MQFDQALCYIQAQPGAAGLSRFDVVALFELAELLEEPRNVFLGNPPPGVGDRDPQELADRFYTFPISLLVQHPFRRAGGAGRDPNF